MQIADSQKKAVIVKQINSHEKIFIEVWLEEQAGHDNTRLN